MKNIILILLLSSISLFVNSQTLKSLNREFETSDANGDSDWNWTKDEIYTIYYKTRYIGGSVNSLQTKLPYYSIYGPASILTVGPDKLDIFPTDGWVFVNRDFGTQSMAPSMPYFTLYNKAKGILRFFYMNTQYEETFSHAVVILSHKKNSSLETTGTLCLSDSENQYLDKLNPDFEQVAISRIQSMEWSYADFEVLSYDPNLPDYAEYTIDIMGVNETDFEAGFDLVEEEEETSSSTFQAVSKSIVDATDQATKYFNSFEKFQNSIEKKAKKDTAEWYSSLLTDIAKSKVVDALPLVGLVGGYISSFIGDEKSSAVSFIEDITLKGKLSTKQDMFTLSLQIPGAKHSRNDSSKPIYDIPLGLIGINEPLVNCYYQIKDGGQYYAQYNYRMKLENLDYVLNNCVSGIEVSNIEIGWIWKNKPVKYYDIETFKNKVFDCFSKQGKYIGTGSSEIFGFFFNKENRKLHPKIALKISVKNRIGDQEKYVTILKSLKPKFKFVTPNEWPSTNTDVIIDYNYKKGFDLWMENQLKSTGNDLIFDEILTSGNIIMGGYGNTIEIKDHGKVNVIAGGDKKILLRNGFTAYKGSRFNAKLLSQVSFESIVQHKNETCPYAIQIGSLKSALYDDQEEYIEEQLSMEHNIERREAKVYPNPSRGFFNVDLPYIDDWSIKIYNASGNLVYSKLLNGDESKIELKTKGMYIIKVIGIEYSVAYKLIIK